MYRVIKMYGDFEPWWFIEGWEDDVIASKKFDNSIHSFNFLCTVYYSEIFENNERIFALFHELYNIFQKIQLFKNDNWI